MLYIVRIISKPICPLYPVSS